MSDFFDSEFVQDAIQDINELQEEIYTEVFAFDKLDQDEKLEHLDKLDTLLEKQRNLYTRMSLSDDPRAKEMRENVRKSAIMMGFPKDVDCGVLFANMQKTLENVRKKIS
jgi:GTPase Era involved in 16S rRNA processing